MKYPHIQQHDERDCGAACLSMITSHYGFDYQLAKIRQLIKVDNQGANIYGIVSGAIALGFQADALEGDYKELTDGINSGEIQFPFIARIINDDGYEHFIVVYEIKHEKISIGDPAKSKITKIDISIFIEQWQRQIIVFVPTDKIEKTERVHSFRKFFKYILNQKKILLIVFLLSIIVTAINISGIFVFQYVINYSVYNEEFAEISSDHEHEHSDEEIDLQDFLIEDTLGKVDRALQGIEEKLDIIFKNLSTVCVTIIIMYIFQCFINVLRGYMLALTSKKVDVPLTLDYYNHLLELPLSFFGTRKTGEYMSRFVDTGKIRDAVSTTTLVIMLDTIMAVACGLVLFYISSTLFIITAIILIIYAVLMLVFKSPIKFVNHELMEEEAQITSYLKESIDGIETIKSHNYENRAKQQTKRKYDKFANKNVLASFIAIIQESLVTGIESIGVVMLLWIGALLCGSKVISLSDLFIFYYMIRYFLDPVKNLINLQPELQTAIVAAERLNDILDVETEDNIKPEIASFNETIQVKGIDFRYGYRELVLKDVSMDFKVGSKTAIVGETGCGKTTLIKLLMAFDKPESGTITIGESEIFDYSPDSIRKRISYISQDIFLFSDSIYNNLRIGNDNITNEDIESICQQCGIDDFIQSLPMGYNTVLEENGNNLSGGQKQRLAIARALLRKPDVLIMDEATSNLDTVTENSIKSVIDNFSENMTCIIIAHRLNTIKNCDYIYVMDKGQVAEEGTHEELLERNGLYSKYINQ